MHPVRSILTVVAAAVALLFSAAQFRSHPAPPILHASVPIQVSPKCLPDDVQMTDIVNETGRHHKAVTVAKKLRSLHARCRKGKLVDRKRREIRFFRLQGCWGNPPVNYGEILARQDEELADLRKKYTVIELSCNPEGGPVQ